MPMTSPGASSRREFCPHTVSPRCSHPSRIAHRTRLPIQEFLAMQAHLIPHPESRMVLIERRRFLGRLAFEVMIEQAAIFASIVPAHPDKQSDGQQKHQCTRRQTCNAVSSAVTILLACFHDLLEAISLVIGGGVRRQITPLHMKCQGLCFDRQEADRARTVEISPPRLPNITTTPGTGTINKPSS